MVYRFHCILKVINDSQKFKIYYIREFTKPLPGLKFYKPEGDENMPLQICHFGIRIIVCVCVCVCARSGVPNSLQLHELQPTRLLCPWDFPGKNSKVGCHFLLQGIFPKPASPALTGGFFTTEPLGNPKNYFEFQAIEKKQIQEELFAFLLSA